MRPKLQLKADLCVKIFDKGEPKIKFHFTQGI